VEQRDNAHTHRLAHKRALKKNASVSRRDGGEESSRALCLLQAPARRAAAAAAQRTAAPRLPVLHPAIMQFQEGRTFLSPPPQKDQGSCLQGR
jgi:hypothetical protein